MRRGCIAIGKMNCDSCDRTINHGQRYLIIDGEGDEWQRLCLDCCESHGYVSYGTDKGRQIVTFLPKE
jgi:hypothetical protein